jgi:hypothetical protein
MKAVHLICRRAGLGFDGLSAVRGEPGLYHSCCWAFSDREDPRSLVGGWAYLHPVAKSSPSEFGGVVEDVLPAKREGKARQDGFILVIRARTEGRGQPWRGADHGMAWTSGIIEATFPHEMASRTG